MMADVSVAAPLACADAGPPSLREVVTRAGRWDAPRRRCRQPDARPRRQARLPRSARYAAVREADRSVPPRCCGKYSWPRLSTGGGRVHRLFPRAGWKGPGGYTQTGSGGDAVLHSLSRLMHVATHKRPRVPCRGWPGHARRAVRAERVRSGRSPVPPEWEECSGHQAGAEARLAEQVGKRL
jgi:hypothetical protein